MKQIDFRARQEQRGVFHQRIGNTITDLVVCDSYDDAFLFLTVIPNFAKMSLIN